MSPEEYLKIYCAPLAEAAARLREMPEAPEPELPLLRRKHYYSDLEPAHYMYNFHIDQLTRDELLRLVREIGIGDPSILMPGQLLGELRERRRISEERLELFQDRERQVVALRQMLENPSYIWFRRGLTPLRIVRRLLARAVSHLRLFL